MNKRSVGDWISRPHVKNVLLSFKEPITPRRVEKIHGISKLKIKPFLENRLLKSLNPSAQKGKLYTLSPEARKLLKLNKTPKTTKTNWEFIGWIAASPKQRLVLLKVVDNVKRTSEELRQRASKFNPRLTRISTKGILRELVDKNLIQTELIDRKRYYWLSKEGELLVPEIN